MAWQDWALVAAEVGLIAMEMPMAALALAGGVGTFKMGEAQAVLDDEHATQEEKQKASVERTAEGVGLLINTAFMGLPLGGALGSAAVRATEEATVEGLTEATIAATEEGLESAGARAAGGSIEATMAEADAAMAEADELIVSNQADPNAAVEIEEDFLGRPSASQYDFSPPDVGVAAYTDLAEVEMSNAATELQGLLTDTASNAEATLLQRGYEAFKNVGADKIAQKGIFAAVQTGEQLVSEFLGLDSFDDDSGVQHTSGPAPTGNNRGPIRNAINAFGSAFGGGKFDTQAFGEHVGTIAGQVIGSVLDFNQGQVVADSNLPDEVIFAVMNRNDSALHQSQSLYAQDGVRTDILFVRGTGNLQEWIKNVTGAENQKLLREQTAQVVSYVKQHPEIKHIIGHSLGAAVAHDAAHLTGRMFCGIDGAMILCRAPGALKARNINKTGGFDRTLDPIGPIERESDGSERGLIERTHHAEKGKYTAEVLGQMGGIPGEDLATGFERGGPNVRSVQGMMQGQIPQQQQQQQQGGFLSKVKNVAQSAGRFVKKVKGYKRKAEDFIGKARKVASFASDVSKRFKLA